MFSCVFRIIVLHGSRLCKLQLILNNTSSLELSSTVLNHKVESDLKGHQIQFPAHCNIHCLSPNIELSSFFKKKNFQGREDTTPWGNRLHWLTVPPVKMFFYVSYLYPWSFISLILSLSTGPNKKSQNPLKCEIFEIVITSTLKPLFC